MYQKYFQVGQFLKTFISPNRPTFLKPDQTGYLPKRWAGHSKWQNIKSTKERQDQLKSLQFSKLARMLRYSVRTGGKDADKNFELKRLLEEAKKINMPKATIQKAMDSAVQLSEKPYWTVFSSPTGVALAFEVEFPKTNYNFLLSKFQYAKKCGFKLEMHYEDLCTERGVIIAETLENIENSYEKALEDGIEIGVNEVFEGEKTLIFECLPDRVESLAQQLSKKGYNIQCAGTEIDFATTLNANESEIGEIENLISKIEKQHEEILRGCHNLVVPQQN